MAEEDEQPNPVDQLVDLFVYAPVGLLYEYQDVLPKLVKRGKSQVQLARVIGQLAMNRRSTDTVTILAEGLAGVVTRQITDIGAAIGLAPPNDSDRSSADAEPQPEPPQPPPPMAVIDDDGPTDDDEDDRPLPIARYDDLTAKEVIELLGDLEHAQLERIRRHESDNRNRKTVLAKIERLGG